MQCSRLGIGHAHSRKYWVIAVVLLLAIPSASIAQLAIGLPSHYVATARDSVQSSLQPVYYPATRSYTGLPYDEQSGMTFTQNFVSLTFNVTAVAQTGPDGDGPAYLLSGLSDMDYWYQVGLSYKWPNDTGGHLPGFEMSYEVFNAYYGISIYPTGGGGGIENFTAPGVSQGDLVLLSLSVGITNVTMSARDLNTGSSALQSYSGFGASSFVGTPSTSLNGFFTGLMTEQYYSSPYKPAGQPVVYSDSDFNYTSATLWIDEWNTQTSQGVFSAQTNGPVDLNSTASDLWPAYLSSNGTSVVASEHAFATGVQPIHLPSVRVTFPTTIHPGDTLALNLTLNNADQTNDRLVDISVVTDWDGSVAISPIDFGPGITNHPISIAIPSNLGNGDHTVNVLGTLQVYEAALNAWIGPGTFETTSVLTVTPQTSAGLTGFLQSLLPEIIAAVAVLAIVAVVLVLVISRRRQPQVAPTPPNVPQTVAFCSRCGQSIASGTLFCPNCGNSLSSPTSQPGGGPRADPSAPPPS